MREKPSKKKESFHHNPVTSWTRQRYPQQLHYLMTTTNIPMTKVSLFLMTSSTIEVDRVDTLGRASTSNMDISATPRRKAVVNRRKILDDDDEDDDEDDDVMQ